MWNTVGEFKVQILDGGCNALVKQGSHKNYFLHIVSGGEGLIDGASIRDVNYKSFLKVMRFLDGIQKKNKTGQYAVCDYSHETQLNEMGSYL